MSKSQVEVSPIRTTGLRVARSACAALLVILIISSIGASQAPKYEMGTFYVCLLIKNPDFKPGAAAEMQTVRERHLKHMQSLIADGKILVSGPFTDNNRIAGVAVSMFPRRKKRERLDHQIRL